MQNFPGFSVIKRQGSLATSPTMGSQIAFTIGHMIENSKPDNRLVHHHIHKSYQKTTYSNLPMRPACQTSAGALFTPGFLCRFLQGKGNSFPCILKGLLYSFPDGFSGTAAKGIGRRIRAWAEIDKIKLKMKRRSIHVFKDISRLFE
jgi:hypothetical protein